MMMNWIVACLRTQTWSQPYSNSWDLLWEGYASGPTKLARALKNAAVQCLKKCDKRELLSAVKCRGRISESRPGFGRPPSE